MNIYRARRIDNNQSIEGNLLFLPNAKKYYIQTETGGFFDSLKIDPSTLEIVKLDFNDAQKKILIQNGKFVLHDLRTDLSELINIYTRITFWNGEDFENKEEFSKLVERVLLLHIEIILEKIKEASQLLKGI